MIRAADCRCLDAESDDARYDAARVCHAYGLLMLLSRASLPRPMIFSVMRCFDAAYASQRAAYFAAARPLFLRCRARAFRGATQRLPADGATLPPISPRHLVLHDAPSATRAYSFRQTHAMSRQADAISQAALRSMPNMTALRWRGAADALYAMRHAMYFATLDAGGAT